MNKMAYYLVIITVMLCIGIYTLLLKTNNIQQNNAQLVRQVAKLQEQLVATDKVIKQFEHRIAVLESENTVDFKALALLDGATDY